MNLPASGLNSHPGTRGTAPPNRARSIGLAVAAVVLAVDQITKSLVVGNIGATDEIRIVGSVRLIRRFNTGMAFSRGSGSPLVGWFVGLVVFVLALWVLRTLWRPPLSPGAPSRAYAAALGALLGGALGNKVDRLVRRGGAVVDFVDVGFWPVFNVADAALSVACVGIVVLSLRHDRAKTVGAVSANSDSIDEGTP